MADTRKLDLKLKRLRAFEGDYRATIKRAEEDYRNDFLTREKFERIKEKQEAKIEKLQPKIRRLLHLRNMMKARG